MVQTEASRSRLHTELAAALSPESAEELMSLLPPVGWADMATKHDLRQEGAILRAELRSEMAELRTELKTDMAALRTELKTEMGELRTEITSVRTDMAHEMRRQTLALVATIVALNGVTWATVTFGG